MKMIYVTCNVSVREPLINLLEEHEISDYQVIEQVPAKNVKGDPRLNTAVWPSHNSSIFMQFSDDEMAREIMKIIRDFNREAYNDNELVTACMWTLDDYFYE
ncbi:MAG: PG0541 family transporter-associated protein [Bacteroidales bacterium]